MHFTLFDFDAKANEKENMENGFSIHSTRRSLHASLYVFLPVTQKKTKGERVENQIQIRRMLQANNESVVKRKITGHGNMQHHRSECY